MQASWVLCCVRTSRWQLPHTCRGQTKGGAAVSGGDGGGEQVAAGGGGGPHRQLVQRSGLSCSTSSALEHQADPLAQARRVVAGWGPAILPEVCALLPRSLVIDNPAETQGRNDREARGDAFAD